VYVYVYVGVGVGVCVCYFCCVLATTFHHHTHTHTHKHNLQLTLLERNKLQLTSCLLPTPTTHFLAIYYTILTHTFTSTTHTHTPTAHTHTHTSYSSRCWSASAPKRQLTSCLLPTTHDLMKKTIQNHILGYNYNQFITKSLTQPQT
jgi:hypothetical protein